MIPLDVERSWEQLTEDERGWFAAGAEGALGMTLTEDYARELWDEWRRRR